VRIAGEPRKEWVAEVGSGKSYVHMPTIESLGDGRVMVAWQTAGRAEAEDDQHMVYTVGGPGAGAGRRWSTPKTVPGRHRGIPWSPALFRGGGKGAGRVHLFYCESHKCWNCESYKCLDAQKAEPSLWAAGVDLRKIDLGYDGGAKGYKDRKTGKTYKHIYETPSYVAKFNKDYPTPTWNPGGDIMHTVYDPAADAWSEPRLILPEEGPRRGKPPEVVPKVIANPPTAVVDAATGAERWILPYWRETPRAKSMCTRTAGKPKERDFSSVLVSSDGGETWTDGGAKIAFKDGEYRKGPKPDWLIEGTAVGGAAVHQFFRTSRNVTYAVSSDDGGLSWSEPRPTPLPNANSKTNALRLSNGALLLALNNHRMIPRNLRTKLHVVVSYDEGLSWEVLAKVEDEEAGPQTRHHYPTLKQVGCQLLLVYSTFKRGIRLVELDLAFV